MAPQRPSVDAVVVPSADRLEALTRCLPALTAQFRAFQHAPRLVVVDGSRREAAAVRDLVSGVGGTAEYLGSDAAQVLAGQLGISGTSDEVLNWAILPGDV